MDKFEYKVRSDEIKSLIAEGDYIQAAEIADTIDWRRVKSVMMLCTISDLYKINRRYDDAKNVLMLAYERRPGGRTICYSLCELCIKTEDFVRAINYYKEFVQAAPKDSSRYILQYKLYEAQEVSLEERIAVLEELKKRDYREKWAYELAFLYHRVGLATRCVEECDELILWFGDGKYVVKAMELKMLHQPLSPEQQEVYDHRFDDNSQAGASQEDVRSESDGQSDVYETPEADGQGVVYGQDSVYEQPEGYGQQEPYELPAAYETREEGQLAGGNEIQPEGQSDEIDIQVKTVDVGRFNTINLQAELAAGLQEVLGEDEITHSIVAPMMETDSIPQAPEPDGSSQPEEEIEGTEVFFGETGEIGKPQSGAVSSQAASETEEHAEPKSQLPEKIAATEEPALPQKVVPAGEMPPQEVPESDETARKILDQMRAENSASVEEQILNVQPPKELADVLSQEANGQISLVLPESTVVEKQLTGQMKIEDVLVEWERMKRENEERCREEVRQHVLRQTGPMFTEFEAAARDGLLEQLENGAVSGDADTYMEEAAPETVNQEAGISEAEQREESGYNGEGGAAEAPEMTGEPNSGEGAEEPDNPEYMEDAEEPNNPDCAETAEEADNLEYAGSEEETDNLEYAENVEEADNSEYAENTEEPNNPEYTEEPEWNSEAQDWDKTGESEKSNGGDAFEESEEAGAAGEAVELEEIPSVGGRKPDVERDKAKIRGLTREEKELYAPFIQSRHSREQIVKAIDNISMAAYTGNVIITGEEGMDTMTLAKNMIREVRMMDSNFSGKVAKISGDGMNQRNIEETLEHLNNGALIIQAASGMSDETATALHKSLQQDRLGIVIVLEDTKKAIKKLFAAVPDLLNDFTARMDLEALSNDMLVSFGRRYAREMEYSIDDLGVLALHTRIEELQTIDHAVTVIEVKQIVDEAIHNASRKTLGHFFDILLAKRYDEEDMIVLSEKDFVA